jgi:prepilin-type N-terminal cleavage/methylation domain-containing protein
MKFKRGFSLLELLFVVTIVALVFAFSTPFTMNFYRTQLINDVQSNLIDALQRARHNAVLQKNDSNFGVHIVSGSYTLFQTPDRTYINRVSNQDEVFPVVNDIAFSGPVDIIFSKLTGLPNTTEAIVIAYDKFIRGIVVGSSGVISKDDSVVFVGSSGCVATGGATSTAGGYMIHTFTTVGNDTFEVTSESCEAEVLVVAGGGGGGSNIGGGGGGGGLISTTTSLTSVSSPYTVTVGDGGAHGVYESQWPPTLYGSGHNGGDSIFGTITASGGGGGGGNPYQNPAVGLSGGSGGGAASLIDVGTPSLSGGSGNIPSVSPAQGYNGGSVSNSASGAGGGGGAGGAGGSVTGSSSGNGGVGVSSSISGVSVDYAGGGGGGGLNGVSVGTASHGGGAGGGATNQTGTSGAENTGGGGGAGGGGNGWAPSLGGDGGSGVVIVRYPAN